ncbi:hypothetical protein JL720_12435 [Aureococcus anophagefferens]|nr:hypothetical protein JL720_12435 [Aureococcus anophagefferens]
MARSWGFLALALCSYVTTFAPPTQQITRYSTLAANSARRRTTLSFPPSRRGRILLSTTVAAEVVNATAPAEASAEAPAPPSRRETHYDALGLRRDATDAQIRSSYRTMSKTCHPDVDPSEASRAKFDAINEAYATLKTAKTRDAYDYELRKEDLAESAEQWVDDALVPFVRDTAAPTLGAVGWVMGAAFGAALKTARANDVSPASAVAAPWASASAGPGPPRASRRRARGGGEPRARTAAPAARTAAPAARTAAPTSNTTATPGIAARRAAELAAERPGAARTAAPAARTTAPTPNTTVTPGIAARRAAELAAERSGTARTAAPAALTSEPSTASARRDADDGARAEQRDDADGARAEQRDDADDARDGAFEAVAEAVRGRRGRRAAGALELERPRGPGALEPDRGRRDRIAAAETDDGPRRRRRHRGGDGNADGAEAAASKPSAVDEAAAMPKRTAPSKPSAPKPSAVDEAAATARSASDETAAAPRTIRDTGIAAAPRPSAAPPAIYGESC